MAKKPDSAQWWNNRDINERKGVIEEIKEKYEHLTVTDLFKVEGEKYEQ